MMLEENNKYKKEKNDSCVQITITEAEKEKWEKFLKEQKKNEKTSIRIRIESDIKNSWRDFVEKSDKFKNVSQLIRVAVNDFIFPDYSHRLLKTNQIPDEFNACFKNSLTLIDNWENFYEIRELEEIIKKFNNTVKKECKKETVQKKLLEIQNLLLKTILEISILVEPSNL